MVISITTSRSYYEPEVKGMSSLSSNTQNMAFVSSSNNNTNSTNEAVNTAYEVSTASTQVNAAYSKNIDNLSDVVIYSSLVVPIFQQGEDLIECINKAMAFLSVVASRQSQSFVGTRNRGIATTSRGNYATSQPKVVKCYNCQGKGNMVRQCTQPKRPRNVAWFKEKLMLAKAQEAGKILDEEQLAFLPDPGISEALVAQQTIPYNSAFYTEDLDAYDSDCDNLSLAKVVLMANLSSCDSDVLSESQDAVIQDTNSSAPNDLLVLSLVEQMTDHVVNLDKENQTNKMVNESLTAELKRYKERVAIFEQRLNVDLNKREKLIDSQMDDLIWNRNAKLATFQQEIDTLKETLSNHVK
ncbi:hypothetical protein Tco_1236965 [Tanacetum coccineum]